MVDGRKVVERRVGTEVMNAGAMVVVVVVVVGVFVGGLGLLVIGVWRI